MSLSNFGLVMIISAIVKNRGFIFGFPCSGVKLIALFDDFRVGFLFLWSYLYVGYGLFRREPSQSHAMKDLGFVRSEFSYQLNFLQKGFSTMWGPIHRKSAKKFCSLVICFRLWSIRILWFFQFWCFSCRTALYTWCMLEGCFCERLSKRFLFG